MGGRHQRRTGPADGAPEQDAPSARTWGRRLQRGDADAVHEVHRRVAKILVHGTLPIPAPDREELEQEIVTEIWQAVNRSRFDFSGGFWGFVEVVTSRRTIDWLRAHRERVPLPEDMSSHERGPLRLALDREDGALVSEILSDLGEACRELLVLRLRDEQSYKEIAHATGKSEGALRVQLYRCVRRARELLRQRKENQR